MSRVPRSRGPWWRAIDPARASRSIDIHLQLILSQFSTGEVFRCARGCPEMLQQTGDSTDVDEGAVGLDAAEVSGTNSAHSRRFILRSPRPAMA